MTYQTPSQSGDAQYTGRVSANATDEVNYYALIAVDFKLTVQGIAQAAPDVEGFADPNFQSFVDHIRSWPGFTLPPGSGYTTIDSTQTTASKSYPVSGEVTTP